MSEAQVSEAGALAAFNLYLGGMSARGTLESGAETISKPRRELVDLFLAESPEFTGHREALVVGDDVMMSRDKVRQQLPPDVSAD